MKLIKQIWSFVWPLLLIALVFTLLLFAFAWALDGLTTDVDQYIRSLINEAG